MQNKLNVLIASMIITAATAFAGGNVNQTDTAMNSSNAAAPGSSGAEFVLTNGVKVIYKEIDDNPLATIQIFSKGGIINESPDKAGITHMTQLMLQQGTKTRSAERLASETENIGASIQSDTGYDYSSIGISSLDSNIDKAAELLSDMILNPAFDDKELEKEKANTLAELKSRKDQISTAAGDAFNSAFYGTHPYSWPEAGKPLTVSKLKRSDLVTWHSAYYASNNIVIVIAGKINLEAANELAGRYFAGISPGPALPTALKVAPPKARTIVERTEKFKQAFLMEGFAAPAATIDEFYALKVLNGVLGGRMTGRLFVELREKLSLAYEVSSYYPSRKELSRFVIYMGLDGQNIPLAKKRIAELLDDLTKTPVPDGELNDTKNFIRGIYLLDRQTIGRKAWYLGWWEVMGLGYAYDQVYLDNIMAVTPQDIQKAAQKYLTASMVSVELIPVKPTAKKAPKKSSK